MALMHFLKPKNKLEEGGRGAEALKSAAKEQERKCPNCRKEIPVSRLRRNQLVCDCGYHFRMRARQRIRMIADKGTFEETDAGLHALDPLHFPGYPEKAEAARAASSETEAVVCGIASVEGVKCALFAMEPGFMMGSMGSAVGEKITRLFERASAEKLPVIGYTVSGGARMQEGLLSLMQMAKTSAAIRRHSDAGLLYIAILTDPTTGGVTASFAMEADIILAEPGATVGFAGARVIEQTTGKSLPKGFQKAEFVLEHGFIDGIANRNEQKATVAAFLKAHSAAPSQGETAWTESDCDTAGGEDTPFEKKSPCDEEIISAYSRVKTARDSSRPTGLDYIRSIFTDFYEMHGDRQYADDHAIVGGIARLRSKQEEASGGMPVTVIAIEKGHTAKEHAYRNFGAPHPEGYRKALRLMKQAEKFARPVICLIDTSGAYCGIGAEERGQGQAIAQNLMEMSALKVPVISILIGEGGSGGALGLAVADRVWMLENAVYSVISPEGCASILWKDAAKAPEAAEGLRLTAEDAANLGVAERILSEENIGTDVFYDRIRQLLVKELSRLCKEEQLIEKRYARFRSIGRSAVIEE